MNENREEAINKLKKIHSLTSSDKAGEAQAAQELLTKLLKKYHLTIEDIADKETLKRYVFKYANSYEDRLIQQVIYTVVNGKRDCKYYYATNHNGNKMRASGVDLTTAEYVQAREMLEAYKPALKKSLKDICDNAYEAFLMRNNIYPDSSEAEDRELTPEELKRLTQIHQISDAIERVEIYKKIGVANEE